MAPIKPPGENATNSGSTGNSNGVVKRRNRIPLSCESCRSRKLKCDRQKPCQNCKARDQGSNCVYAADEGKANRGNHLMNLSMDMGDRIHKLEALVNSMLTAQQATSAAAALPTQPQAQVMIPTPAPTVAVSHDSTEYAPVDDLLQHNGPYAAITDVEEGQHFLGPSHWEAVLRDISAIREAIEETSYKLRAPTLIDTERPTMLRGTSPSISKASIIQNLPAKSMADRLLTRFWDYQEPSMPLIIHQSTFKVHFDEAYRNIESISFTELAMLLVVFAMALQTYERHGPEPPDLRGHIPDLANKYRQFAADCLWAADIAAPGPDVVVAFYLYWINELSRCQKAVSGLWMLQAMVIRKATLMGYHRDPSTFPEISIFEGEMRRRLWHTLCQSDLLLSFHLGMPSMVDYSHTDVQSPRSLYEDSLYENMTALPAERPKNEKTPIAYAIGKRRIFQTFSSIVRAINSVYPPSDDEVASLNAKLAAAYEDCHPHLQHETEGETEAQRIQRSVIANVYHKAICVLNRRSLFINNRTSIQEQSRDLCIKSALTLLSIQDQMHRAGDRWYEWIFTRNDYLLATVLVCMILYTFKKYAKPDSNMFDQPSVDEESDYRLHLARAKDIWVQLIDIVPEARKAWRIIEVTLYQTTDQKPNVSTESVDLAVLSVLGDNTLPTPDYAPNYPSIDFDKIDWDSWDKMIQGSSMDDTVSVAAEQILNPHVFGVTGFENM